MTGDVDILYKYIPARSCFKVSQRWAMERCELHSLQL